ncbi:hypothetical protein [Streptomyces sp. NPDC058758]|uniref:hypothetical protein n=1 Tax=Streptomyces sp. NPDC058758 TaxID=3346627 RepID=UPI0036B20E8F
MNVSYSNEIPDVPAADSEPPAPKAGQVWRDNDSRLRFAEPRYLRIIEIDGTHAVMERVTLTPQGEATVAPGARPSRVRLDRLRPTSTGYIYVQG